MRVDLYIVKGIKETYSLTYLNVEDEQEILFWCFEEFLGYSVGHHHDGGLREFLINHLEIQCYLWGEGKYKLTLEGNNYMDTVVKEVEFRGPVL